MRRAGHIVHSFFEFEIDVQTFAPLPPRGMVLSGMLLAGAVAAPVEAAEPFKFSGQLSAASLGMNKGLVETGDSPQLFLITQAKRGPWFAAAKIRNIHNSSHARNQQEYAAGIQTTHGGVGVDLHVATKINGGMHGPASRYVEWEGEFTRRFYDMLTLRVQIDVTQNKGYVETELWTDVNGVKKLDERWSLVGALGLRSTPSTHYKAANIGLAYALAKDLAVDVRYFDTDRHELGERYRGHTVARLTRKF